VLVGTYKDRRAGSTPRSLPLAASLEIAAEAVTGNRSDSKARGNGSMAQIEMVQAEFRLHLALLHDITYV
jgi:hypothetical protein